MIVIVDYGIGNPGSILNMIKKIGISDCIVSSDFKDIENASKLILPGVGAFDNAMSNLIDGEFLPILNKKVIEQRAICLGICLGMQMLFERSEEGKLEGLGWINGEVVKFKFDKDEEQLRIPHMGWNIVKRKQETPFLSNMYDESRFYFVHSYHVECTDAESVIMTTEYGYEFIVGVKKDHIYGVQFHPEKSHKFGKKLLENFCKL